jgi:CRISPR/Cas system-associated exonuclease Cas4 (RecB family)
MFERTPLFPTLDEIIDFFHHHWQEAWEKLKKEEKISEEISKVYLKEGVSMLQNFYKKNPPWNFNIVEVESRFTVIIDDPRDNQSHVLTGIIDRVDKPREEDGVYEIIDYKTSKRMLSQEMADKDMQLSIYNLGLLKKCPHLVPEKIRLSFYYLKHNEKIETKRSAQALEDTKEQILKIIHEVQATVDKNQEFIPTPSALCDWCGYIKICPMWRHLYVKSKAPSTKSEAEIRTLISEYFALKEQSNQNNARLKQIMAQINDFMDQEGVTRVFGEKGYFTRILQEREVFDSKKAKEILAELGKLKEVLFKKQCVTLRGTKKKMDKI